METIILILLYVLSVIIARYVHIKVHGREDAKCRNVLV